MAFKEKLSNVRIITIMYFVTFKRASKLVSEKQRRYHDIFISYCSLVNCDQLNNHSLRNDI